MHTIKETVVSRTLIFVSSGAGFRVVRLWIKISCLAPWGLAEVPLCHDTCVLLPPLIEDPKADAKIEVT